PSQAAAVACDGATRVVSSVGVVFTFTTISYQSGSSCDQYTIGFEIGVNIDKIGCADYFPCSKTGDAVIGLSSLTEPRAHQHFMVGG
ncbi:hypothetical protein ACC736_38350, partial [Rhizobium ruizarguesonis]